MQSYLDPEHDDPKEPKGAPYAIDYPDCLDIVKERVKPRRDTLPPTNHFNKGASKYWWRYGGPRVELYGAIAKCNRILVIPRVSKYLNVSFSSPRIVSNEQTIVIASESLVDFLILQSTVHQAWTRVNQSSLETRGRYTSSDCFETFPFPKKTDDLEDIGDRYYTHRQSIMLTRQEGLTKTYNRFHDPNQTDPDIQTLRDLHIQMDNAVAAAYGWRDLDLAHDFHQTKQGLRFTISEDARREVLDRLLELNHQRYADEVALGLHDKKKKRGKGKRKGKSTRSKGKAPSDSVQGSLF